MKAIMWIGIAIWSLLFILNLIEPHGLGKFVTGSAILIIIIDMIITIMTGE